MPGAPHRDDVAHEVRESELRSLRHVTKRCRALDATLGGSYEPDDSFYECRLAAAVRPEHREHVARAHGQRNAAPKPGPVAKADAQVLGLNQHAIPARRCDARDR